MKIKELKNKSDSELKALLADTQDKNRQLGFKVSQKQLKNVRQIRDTKKTIAQIKTLINQSKTK